MNRRGFLTMLAGAGALIVPARAFFLPPAGGWPRDCHPYNGNYQPPDFIRVYADHSLGPMDFRYEPVTATEVLMRQREAEAAMARMIEDFRIFGTGAISMERTLEGYMRTSHVPVELLRLNHLDIFEQLSA